MNFVHATERSGVGGRPSQRATADRGGSDKPFEKGLSENFSPCGSREVGQKFGLLHIFMNRKV